MNQVPIGDIGVVPIQQKIVNRFVRVGFNRINRPDSHWFECRLPGDLPSSRTNTDSRQFPVSSKHQQAISDPHGRYPQMRVLPKRRCWADGAPTRRRHEGMLLGHKGPSAIDPVQQALRQGYLFYFTNSVDTSVITQYLVANLDQFDGLLASIRHANPCPRAETGFGKGGTPPQTTGFHVHHHGCQNQRGGQGREGNRPNWARAQRALLFSAFVHGSSPSVVMLFGSLS